jgi:hypothetical protein
MKKFLVFNFIFLILLVLPAGAEWLSDGTPGGYRLWLVRTCGSAVKLEDAGHIYTLQDIKGQGYTGGAKTGDGYTLYDGGIYVLVAGTPEVVIPPSHTEGPDDGLIKNTRIERTSDGKIKLYWQLNGAANADIWRMSGNSPTEFSNNTILYDRINSAPIVAPPEFEDAPSKVRVGDGKDAYYRVVPGGTLQANIFNAALNKRTVGKVDIHLGSAYNFVGYPFNAATIDIPTLIGIQLREGDQVHWWDQAGQSYGLATKTASWPSPHTFNLADGLLVYLTGSGRTENLTLVGLVDNFITTGVSKSLGSRYNLVGYPYPVVRLASDIGLSPQEGDQIHIWDWATQNFRMTTYVGGAWGDVGLTRFNLAEGKFYYKLAPETWNLRF